VSKGVVELLAAGFVEQRVFLAGEACVYEFVQFRYRQQACWSVVKERNYQVRGEKERGGKKKGAVKPDCGRR
jgi:hypothetical protein